MSFDFREIIGSENIFVS